MRSSNLPERSAGRFNAFCLVLLRMGFSLQRLVTKRTVRSYRTFSPLPVLPKGNHRRFCSLFHFPSRYRARPLAGILPCAARTFLPASLTRCAATACSACVHCDYSTALSSKGRLKNACCFALSFFRRPSYFQTASTAAFALVCAISHSLPPTCICYFVSHTNLQLAYFLKLFGHSLHSLSNHLFPFTRPYH